MTKNTRTKAISEFCRQCNYDEQSAGTFLQQTAICACASCPLHPFRPVPRGFRFGGKVDQASVSKLRNEIDRINADIVDR